MDPAVNDGRIEEVLDPTNRIAASKSPGPKTKDDDSLLDMEKGEAARRVMKDWDESWKDIRNLSEQWKVNKARAEGYTGVQLVKRQDRNEALLPLGAKKSVSGMNKAARLKRRVRSVMFNDPPVPECTPSGDDDDARDAAETGTRILQYQCSEGQLDFNLVAADAFDMASNYGSGFIRFWVDETGGGFLPKQVEASPQAVDPNDPYPVDPMTGIKRPCDPILRYVTETGQFTEQRNEAERVWLPKIRREVLTGKHVRFLPFNVRDLWEADGVMVGCAVSLGTLKKMFPEMRKWPEDRILKVCETRPQHFQDLLPAGRKSQPGDPKKDDTLVFVLARYHVQSPLYPEGAYLIAAGSEELLYRGTWFDEEHAEALDIPLTQFKQLTEEDNPYGKGLMEDLGPGNELRSAMYGAELEHLDRFNNRKIFASMISPLAGNPQLMQAPTGTPIPIMPGTAPIYEEIPDFPVIVEKMLAQASTEMDDESGLQQSGQGLNSPSVKSGVHANAVWQQVQMGLTDLRENTQRGLIRGWRVMMQLDRAFFSEPQLMRWQSPDGRFKLKRWTGADFADTTEVRVQRGSFTLLTPSAKAELAQTYGPQGMNLLTQADLEHVTEGNIGGLFGLQDNPHRNRVRLQIAKWQDGPPEGWNPPQAPIDPMTGQPQVDPQTGQPMAPPPDPTLAQMFDTRAVDTQPDVAAIRVYELGRTMSSTAFRRWEQFPAWQQALTQAYTQARQAAQVMDAETTQKMQQESQKKDQKIAEQGAKLAEKPNISVSVPSAMQLDANQTLALFAAEGVQLPPGGVMEPQEDPNLKLQVEREIQGKQIDAEVVKHRSTEAAKVEQARVKTGGKVARSQAKAGRPQKAAPNITVQPPSVTTPVTVNLPESKAKGMRVVRDAKGAITGSEPNE